MTDARVLEGHFPIKERSNSLTIEKLGVLNVVDPVSAFLSVNVEIEVEQPSS